MSEQSERYSRLKHLIYAIDMNRDKERRVIGMYTSYFDESENPAQPTVMVVAGYAAKFLDWLKFEDEWLAALKREGVEHFHMRDFVPCERTFRDWKGDNVRRKNLLDTLSGIIVKYVCNSFSYAVQIDIFNEVDARFMLREFLGEPYSLCAAACARAAREWAESVDSRMICIFDDDATHKKDFKKLMERMGEPDPAFGSRGDYTQLEAADFIAWSHLRYFRPMSEPMAEVFGDALETLKSVPQYWRKFRQEDLEGMCQDMNAPSRQTNVHMHKGKMKARLWGRALTNKEIEDRFNSQ